MALNVLVVDDSAVARAMIVRTLGLSGLELGDVHQAPDGAQGLASLETHWVDLVITDINMPVMNGQEMIDRMRANPAWADLPVLVISTEGSQARIEQLCGQGVRFVHKPFSPEAIRDAVGQIVGRCNE